MMFNLHKFRHYLWENTFILYTDHQALKYLFNKPVHQGWIFRWLLLFQEFQVEIIVQLGKQNVGSNHLSRLESQGELTEIDNDLLDAHLFQIEAVPSELAEISEVLHTSKSSEEINEKKKKILAIKVAPYTLINDQLYKLGIDEVLWRCVLKHEGEAIINEAQKGGSR